MAATYQVHVLNSDGDIAMLLDTVAIASLRYSRVLNDVGTFQMTLPVEGHEVAAQVNRLTQLLTVDGNEDLDLSTVKDRLVEVWRFVDDDDYHEGTFILRYVRVFEDDDGRQWCIVSGFSPEYLLLQRCIDPRNDPLVAGGYSTKSGPADDVMVSYVNEQAGPLAATEQQVPYLSVQASAGVGQTSGARQQWEGLLETLQLLSEQGEMDFRVDHSGGVSFKFIAEVVGEDRTYTTHYGLGEPFVLLDPALGNMASPDLEHDWRQEKTAVALLGRGSDDDRELYGVSSGAIADTPYSYAMAIEDAREVEEGDATQYITQGKDALKEHRATQAFKFALINPELQYRVLWDMGDVVTVRWQDFFDADMRFTAIEVVVTGDSELVSPQLELIV